MGGMDNVLWRNLVCENTILEKAIRRKGKELVAAGLETCVFMEGDVARACTGVSKIIPRHGTNHVLCSHVNAALPADAAAGCGKKKRPS